MFSGKLRELKGKAVNVYKDAVQHSQSREDYRELLQLSLAFLSGGDYIPPFRPPGAMHNARWMSKAIYSLKITLFKDQFKLTAREEGLTAISMWVAPVYAKFWHEAPLAERAPLNDVQLLKDLHRYPERAIRDASTKAFRRHLWFFSEHMIDLALFDHRVSDATRRWLRTSLARHRRRPRSAWTAQPSTPELRWRTTCRSGPFICSTCSPRTAGRKPRPS
jgi:hypothetical protein